MSTNISEEPPASISRTLFHSFILKKETRSSSETLLPIYHTTWCYITEDQNLDTTVRIWNTTHLVFCFLRYLTYICNVAENIDSWKEMAYKWMVRWHGCVWRCHGIQIKVMCILNGVSHPHLSCALFPVTQSGFSLLPTSHRPALQPACVTYHIHTLPTLTMTMVEACPSKMLIFTYKTTQVSQPRDHNLNTHCHLNC